MKRKISILFFPTPVGAPEDEGRRSLPERLFTDLTLDRLLPDETLAQLARGCTPDEAEARRSVFRRLLGSDGALREAFAGFDAALTGLGQAETACASAKSEVEALFLFRRRCRFFCEAVSAAERLSALDAEAGTDSSALLAGLGAYAEKLLPLAAELEKALAETASSAEELSNLRLRLDRTGVLTALRSDDAAASSPAPIAETLRRYIVRTGYEPKLRPQSSDRFPPELSDTVKQICPEAFRTLYELRERFDRFLDADLTALRGEIRFYLTVAELAERGKRAGMAVCFPTVIKEKRFCALNAYDLTLLVRDRPVVPNDIDFDESAPVCFLTGANGGGKTTYLRCTAANLLFGLRGCPVFAASMELYPFDWLCSHFPADETFTGSGRLVEEANRVNALLLQGTGDSFFFFNETFSGTDDGKGVSLTLETARKLRETGAFALFVTHFHEVEDSGFPILTTVMDETDTSRRTFRIVRAKGGGSSFAADILKKYGLDALSLKRRAEETSAG